MIARNTTRKPELQQSIANTTINSTKYSRTLRRLTQECYTVIYVEKRTERELERGKREKQLTLTMEKIMLKIEENEDPSGKKRLRRSPGSTTETFKTYVEERRQDNQLMLDRLEKMHNEETAILGSLLNIFKELVKK